MKIIKVVHSKMSTEMLLERQLLTIQTYDINDFLKRHEADIISKSKVDKKELLSNFSVFDPFYLAFLAMIPLSDLRIKWAIAGTASMLLEDIFSKLQEDDLEIISLESAREKYPRTHNISIGTYTLHPYDNERLTRLESYHKNLALEKDDELITLLGKMGAKTLRIMESDTQKKSGAGSLGVDTVAVDVEVGTNISQGTDRSKDLLVTFEDNIVDISPYLLKTSLWFSNDSRLNAIFESRRFDPNKIQRYTLRNTYTETFDFDFNLAAKYLAIKVDLKAEYDSISKKECFFHVEFGK